jgi:CDP-glucose 4,6-dehydratase
VLDCLSGYLALGARLLQAELAFAAAWNFGPGPEANRTVSQMLGSLRAHWPAATWRQAATAQPHEAGLLQVDSARAHQLLGWRPTWRFETAIARTAHWYRQWLERGALATDEDLRTFVTDARAAGIPWST